jgi:hypothetical protein
VNEHRALLYLAWTTLGVVSFIAVYLVWHRGAGPETARVVKAIEEGGAAETAKILTAIEGGRQQASVHQAVVESDLRTIRTRLRDLLTRFGFLRAPP